MTREQIDELAAAYALGTLEGDERARFEALLAARDPDATSSLQRCEEAIVAMAEDLRAAPPPRVKTALIGRIAAEGVSPAALPPAPSAPRRRAVLPLVWAGAMAAGIAALAVGFAVSARYEARLQDLAREAAVLREDLARQQALVTILRDPATQVVTLAGQAPSPEARGRALWHATAGGLVVTTGLPAPPAGKTYQLWAIVGAKPIPAGVFSPDARGVASLQVAPIGGVSRVDVFAVTLEPAGGLPAPSGPMYLVGKS